MRRPGVFVGVLAVAAIAYISFNSLRTEGPGSRGVAVGHASCRRSPCRSRCRELEGDANVSERACDVRGRDVLNVCELAERGPVVLAFFAEPSERCDDQIDVVDRVRSRFPEVQFAAVAIRGDRKDLRRRVRERGWTLPVGHDQDGAVANAYAVAICPAITLAARGGNVERTLLGVQDERALESAVRALG